MSDESDFTRLADLRLTIVGLGLMGGSLAMALRGKVARLTGVDADPATRQAALARGVVDSATSDLAEGVSNADGVVLATPVQTILRLLGTIGPHLTDGCLVMDLGSTKHTVVEAMNRLPPHVMAVGGHPMCGKEISGLAAAEATLFRGCRFVLCPTGRSPEPALRLARALVEAVGADVVEMDAERHDRLTAAVSHLPYLLSVALVGAVKTVADEDPLAWRLAASGFHDTSRLAASQPIMMRDILLTNREASLDALEQAVDVLLGLAAEIRAEDSEALLARLTAIQRARMDWEASR
jgi:prephenate dehydrogenase